MQQNTLTLIGTVATDILTSQEDDVATARFRLVIHSRQFDRAVGTWVNGQPTFMTVTCRKRLALHVASSLRRGDPVIVTGRLRVQEGRDRRLTRVEIEALGVGPDLNRVTAVPARQTTGAVA